MKLPSARPFFPTEDIDAILGDIRHVLQTGQLTLGPYAQQLEDQFAAYIGVDYSVAVNSGTRALEIALRSFDLRGREVIVPTNSFVASANAVIFAGGVPKLADIKAETLCIDPADLRAKIGPQTAGVMVVHLAGLIPPEMDEIHQICVQHGLFLIEDAAQAHGAAISGRKAGSLGDVGCFSFFPTKPMTTGEGGMITTNDSRLATLARSLRNHGLGEGGYATLGYNWRMSEIHAVLGIHQLARLDDFVEQRNYIAELYTQSLASTKSVTLLQKPPSIRHSYYKYPVLFHPGVNTRQVQKTLQEEYNIETGALYYPPIHLQPFYRQTYGYAEGSLPVSEDVLSRQLCLPMFPEMTPEMVEYGVSALKATLNEANPR